jgi:hypothetical protein
VQRAKVAAFHVILQKRTGGVYVLRCSIQRRGGL